MVAGDQYLLHCREAAKFSHISKPCTHLPVSPGTSFPGSECRACCVAEQVEITCWTYSTGVSIEHAVGSCLLCFFLTALRKTKTDFSPLYVLHGPHSDSPEILPMLPYHDEPPPPKFWQVQIACSPRYPCFLTFWASSLSVTGVEPLSLPAVTRAVHAC